MIQLQHAKPTQVVQDQEQEEAYPRSGCNDAPTCWNWYLALQHAKEYTEVATQESRKKQVQLLEEEVPTELKVLLTLSGTLTSLLNTPLRSRPWLP